ncbi:hypothetical protein [Agaribacter marinus]|uniref:Uncharacterized protein n=1 Tax=Agaribacter marinus TaxID=1431249 RepID=A0AA37WKR7_9ALTE|nr:hypothetical protein [Agaribacter marinus]GLR71839.1 hypothetical protein GCM10007852_27470 [Agaribacter marinus]
MTTKVTSAKASNDALGDLEQLRMIVFGAAKQELDEKIDALNQRLSDEMQQIQTQISLQFSDMQKNIAENQQILLSKLNDTDNTQDTNQQKLIEITERLNSQIEMAENAGRDEAKNLHARMDNEVNALQADLADAVERLMTKLDAVSKDLTSSKTDRKTLAQLLANVATNLDADE